MAPWSYALAADSSLPCMPVRRERSKQGKGWVAVLLGACAAFLHGLSRRFGLAHWLVAGRPELARPHRLQKQQGRAATALTQVVALALVGHLGLPAPVAAAQAHALVPARQQGGERLGRLPQLSSALQTPNLPITQDLYCHPARPACSLGGLDKWHGVQRHSGSCARSCRRVLNCRARLCCLVRRGGGQHAGVRIWIQRARKRLRSSRGGFCSSSSVASGSSQQGCVGEHGRVGGR